MGRRRQDMAQKVWVKVVGFDDVERHTLNTLFRVSGDSDTAFALWAPDCGSEARLALIDSQSYEARVEFESPLNAGLKMVWVGPHPSPRAWRSFQRPLQWPEVIATMAEAMQPLQPLDLDLEASGAESRAAKRALVAGADRGERLYLRARLALAGLTQVDEAENGSQALELLRGRRYEVAFLDFALPGIGGWDLVQQATAVQPRVPLVAVTKASVSTHERLKARTSGVALLLAKPPHPGKLRDLLEKV
ncbi:MAG: response regulator [Comamonadaceae bacterium]|nr:MAG: response regulator [Comamonadaceae bacterium]